MPLVLQTGAGLTQRAQTVSLVMQPGAGSTGRNAMFNALRIR